MFWQNGIKNMGITINKKKKILFILPSLKAGGAERVLSFLAKELDDSLFEIKLIVLGFPKDAVYNTDGINVIYLYKYRFLSSFFLLVKIFKKEKPHIVFTSIGHINFSMGFLNYFFKDIFFIAREASVVSKRRGFSAKNTKIPKFLVTLSYSNLSKIVCQSKDMKNDFINYLGIKEKKLIVINNPITAKFNSFDNKKSTNKCALDIRFITVGRLTKEKGHERILTALAKIKNYSFTYTLVGSGVLENYIKNLAKELKILENINFIPYTNKVLEHLTESDYFIQGSYVEGFPNALLESCSIGTPVIALKCPGGTKEIIENNINGYYLNNQEDFEKLLLILNKLPILDREKVKNSVINKFSSSKIISEYQNLFLNIK